MFKVLFSLDAKHKELVEVPNIHMTYKANGTLISFEVNGTTHTLFSDSTNVTDIITKRTSAGILIFTDLDVYKADCTLPGNVLDDCNSTLPDYLLKRTVEYFICLDDTQKQYIANAYSTIYKYLIANDIQSLSYFDYNQLADSFEDVFARDTDTLVTLVKSLLSGDFAFAESFISKTYPVIDNLLRRGKIPMLNKYMVLAMLDKIISMCPYPSETINLTALERQAESCI